MKIIKTIAAAGLLFGATSVMAQDPTNVGSGEFKFLINEEITIDCWNSDWAIYDIDDMTVPDAPDLKEAKATIECAIKNTISNWTLSLTATNKGKMLRQNVDGAPEYLQVNDDDGILGMWVELVAPSPEAFGTWVNIVTNKGKSLVTDGDVQPNGDSITDLEHEVNLSQVLQDGTTSGDTYLMSKNGANINLAIHAAFVGGTITSTEGEYVEIITINVEALTI